MAKLNWKPCPFCGEEEVEVTPEDVWDGDACVRVSCKFCSADVWYFNREGTFCDYETMIARLNKKWNTRFPEKKESESHD